MKNVIRRFFWLLLVAMCMGTGSISAQDLAFTQFFANKVYLNPAYSGYEYGTNVYSNYRIQWASLGGSPSYFIGQALAVSSEASRNGFGLMAVDRKYGSGPYRWSKYAASYAWKLRRCEDDPLENGFDFSLGVRGSYNTMSIDWSQFTFSSQYNPIYGFIAGSTPSLAVNEVLQGSYWDVDAGGIVEFTSFDNNYFRLGLAANNLMRTNPSAGFLNDTIGVRWTIHGSMELGRKLGRNIPVTVAPVFKYEQQRSYGTARGYVYRIFDGGVMFQHSAPTGQEIALGGMWHFAGFLKPKRFDSDTVGTGSISTGQYDGLRQTTNGVSAYFAIQQPISDDNALRASVSYQFDYSGLRSNSGGILEFALALKFFRGDLTGCRRSKGRNGNLNCDDF